MSLLWSVVTRGRHLLRGTPTSDPTPNTLNPERKAGVDPNAVMENYFYANQICTKRLLRVGRYPRPSPSAWCPHSTIGVSSYKARRTLGVVIP